MDITITIPDEQWEAFQEAAQEAVEQSWDGKYEDFATYIMTVNIKSYVESQQRKQEKMMKKALASYEASMGKETNVSLKHPTVSPPPIEKKDAPMTNKEIAARIEHLQAIAVKKRTLAETTELNNLLRKRNNKNKKK